MCLKIKICKSLISTETIMHNFHPLEVVGHGSETHLQVGENLNNPFIAGGAKRRPPGRPRMLPFGDISNYCF